MGSVIDYPECPNCKHEAYSDFYYKTGEEYMFCNNCGYHYSAVYKRDEDGKLITKDGSNNTSFDNLVIEVKELKNPYGAYRYKFKTDTGYVCGALETEEDAESYISQMKENFDNCIEFAQMSRLVDGEIIVTSLIDSFEN